MNLATISNAQSMRTFCLTPGLIGPSRHLDGRIFHPNAFKASEQSGGRSLNF